MQVPVSHKGNILMKVYVFDLRRNDKQEIEITKRILKSSETYQTALLPLQFLYDTSAL
jgi:hypothetical protein